MEFDLEYSLQLFREEQSDLFDENNERYTATPIGKETAENMLDIINKLESALLDSESKVKKLEFMVENGLGYKDMESDAFIQSF